MSGKVTNFELLVEDLKSYTFIFVWEERAHKEEEFLSKKAFDWLNSLDVSVSWYQSRESLSTQVAYFSTVFVMNSFDTTLYEEIKEGYRIINPICVITSLSNIEKIPISSCRLANMALLRCRVSSSSFPEKVTSWIRERVSLMGGEYTENLLVNTTHLISEVRSWKYDVAVKNNIAVVLYSWLDEAWLSGSSDPNFVVNSTYTKKHKCPVFMKCNVMVSGFTCEERNEIVKLLNSNRTNCTENIVMDGDSQTTHLVTTPAVDSYTLKIAHEHHILVVSKDWVTDCVKHAYRLPEKNDSIEYKQKKRLTVARQKRNTTSDLITEKLNELDYEVDSCEEFLGGCNIYLCGFTESQENRIKKFLNLCKATHLSILNGNVTHVVMGCPTDTQSHKVANFTPAPSFILKCNWLIESWKQQSLLPESDFIIKFAENDKPSKKPSKKKYAQYTKEKFLSNINFCLIDLLPSVLGQIKMNIIVNGGNLVTDDSTITPHYVIVPLDFDKSFADAVMLVTLYWLESSLLAKRLLEPYKDPLFTPVKAFECRNILSNTTVVLAGGRTNNTKMISINQFLSYMGAKVIYRLKINVLVHVCISEDPEHQVAKEAYFSGVPVVTFKWMFECARTKTALSFADFYTYPSSQSSTSPPALSLDFVDRKRYFPRGTTPKTTPHPSSGDITQLAEMYTDNMESLDTRNFSAKQETLELFHTMDVKYDFNDEHADNRGNLSIRGDCNFPNFLPENMTHVRAKKRRRSPNTPVYDTSSSTLSPLNLDQMLQTMRLNSVGEKFEGKPHSEMPVALRYSKSLSTGLQAYQHEILSSSLQEYSSVLYKSSLVRTTKLSYLQRPDTHILQQVLVRIQDMYRLGTLQIVFPKKFNFPTKTRILAGVKLDEAVGNYNGTFDSIRYFDCEHNHAIFISVEEVHVHML